MTSPEERERPGEPEARFACAECGRIAAIVRAVPAGRAAGFERLPGSDRWDRDGAYLGFLGDQWTAIEDPAAFRRLIQVLSMDDPDAASLSKAFPGLAPFRCSTCGACYCAEDWRKVPVWDEGFYDHTLGTCPRGHQAMIDD